MSISDEEDAACELFAKIAKEAKDQGLYMHAQGKRIRDPGHRKHIEDMMTTLYDQGASLIELAEICGSTSAPSQA